MTISAKVRSDVAAKNRRHPKDSGSPEVQVGMLTAKIAEVATHLKAHDKDHHSRRGLVMMVGRRNRLLKYLARTSPEQYQSLIERLGLRK